VPAGTPQYVVEIRGCNFCTVSDAALTRGSGARLFRAVAPPTSALDAIRNTLDTPKRSGMNTDLGDPTKSATDPGFEGFEGASLDRRQVLLDQITFRKQIILHA